MLYIDKVQLIEGVTVYGDHQSWSTFYLLPQQTRYRLDENGNPVFKFLKYRMPVDRADGVKGGGYIIFDAEFVVPEPKFQAVKAQLQANVDREASRRGVQSPPVTIGTITYTDGEAKLNVLNENKQLVAQVFNPGKPSLFGNNITPFSVELTPEGATLAEQALQGKGGLVQVSYMLKFWAKIPPLTVTASFSSSQFYSFFQTIDVEWRLWAEDEYRETVREQLIQTEAMSVVIDEGGNVDAAVIDEVRDWAYRTLESKIENKMIEQIAPVPDDQRKQPDGIEDVTRDIKSTRVSSFTLNYSQSSTEEWDVYPQGTLPNITSLTDGQGNAVKWADYASEVDLDDPFFRQQRVDVRVNADFNALPIHSVEVKLLYKGRPMPALAEGAPEGEAVFTKADDIAKFATFVEGDEWKYTYSYQVNYKGTSKVFASEPVETDEGNITVGVDDVGILLVDIATGDINWTEVTTAQVRFSYTDTDVDPIEEQLELTKDKPSHRIQRVIFTPFRKAYRYQVRYLMADGKEYETDEQEGRSHNLFVNDPFGGRRSVKVLGVVDFANKVDNIFVDLEYADEGNAYNIAKPVVLNEDNPFFDWTFPVISDQLGTLTYAGNVVLKGGTGVRPIPRTTAESDTIIVPKAPREQLKIEIIPDLLDFDEVKLVRMKIVYEDDANLASIREDIVLSKANHTGKGVTIAVFDDAKTSYTWSATFFLTDNSKREVPPTPSSDTALVLELPSA